MGAKEDFSSSFGWARSPTKFWMWASQSSLLQLSTKMGRFQIVNVFKYIRPGNDVKLGQSQISSDWRDDVANPLRQSLQTWTI